MHKMHKQNFWLRYVSAGTGFWRVRSHDLKLASYCSLEPIITHNVISKHYLSQIMSSCIGSFVVVCVLFVCFVCLYFSRMSVLEGVIQYLHKNIDKPVFGEVSIHFCIYICYFSKKEKKKRNINRKMYPHFRDIRTHMKHRGKVYLKCEPYCVYGIKISLCGYN